MTATTTTRHERQIRWMIEAFCRGIRGDDPIGIEHIELPPAFDKDPVFETSHQMSQATTSPDFEAAALRWKCTTRTCRRMHSDGVDLTDAKAVAVYILDLRAPSKDMLEAVLDELSEP